MSGETVSNETRRTDGVYAVETTWDGKEIARHWVSVDELREAIPGFDGLKPKTRRRAVQAFIESRWRPPASVQPGYVAVSS